MGALAGFVPLRVRARSFSQRPKPRELTRIRLWPAKIHIILCRSNKRGSRAMCAAKWGLASILGIATLSIGASEALSQSVRVRVCNQSNLTAYVAVTGHPGDGDGRFLISGWYQTDPG